MDNDVVIYIIRTFFIVTNSYYFTLKINNTQNIKKEKILNVILAIFVSVICGVTYKISNSFNSMMILILLLSVLFHNRKKYSYGYSIVITIISLTINYIMFFIAVSISYLPKYIFSIQNNYMNLLIIILFYDLLIVTLSKVKKFKYGIKFLQKNMENQYFETLVLNISVIILFTIILFSNYDKISARALGVSIIMFSIIIFATIQESLQLYYKQKMLVKDLEETKAELEDKKKEVEALEKENLEFSKVSHSIAHKQKALEYKLNELSMKSEIAEEINLKDRIDDLSKDLRKETIVVLDKTGIDEIDDMLSYMQAECVKNKIDFQLQLSGNIYKMINHYIDKKELEILIADHIKNAIIAIGYGNNINKSILVRLGKLDGSYGLYVYDSGIEFETETLLNLGKKPSTTHKDSGGTGMGFMNTFDTLRKHKASFIIEELGEPAKDNFTKVLKFKFDGKNEFKICSYRDEEIKKKDKENSLTVEKITF